MVDLDAIATSLERSEPGMWVGRASEAVSYPAGTHRMLAELEDESFWFSHRSKVIGSAMARYPPSGCVFDVGGGNGYMVREMRARGLASILVEPGVDGARTALARGLEPVVNATLSTAGFRSESIPAIGLFDVLEHVENDAGFLQDVSRLLESGGRLYLTVPAHRFLWSAEDVRAGHHRRYTATSLRNVLSQAGFEVEYSSYFFIPLPLPIFILRTIPSVLGLRKPELPRADEHRAKSRPLRALVDWLLKGELKAVELGVAPFGSSLIAVARKSV